MDYFEALPPELISLLPLSLPTASLNALVLTCRRLCAILQPALEARITPELGRELLQWAAASSMLIVAKLLAPPHSVDPNYLNPLHVAVQAGNLESATLLLNAGADANKTWDWEWHQPLHHATERKDLAMMRLLLDHGAQLDSTYGCDGCNKSALHYACSIGCMQMVELLLERGASLETQGHYGTALGFAVHGRHPEVVRLLLERGAALPVSVPLFVFLESGLPRPHKADLLYIAMDLRYPTVPGPWRRRGLKKWEGLPLGDERKQLMALLLAHGARKDIAMATITKYLGPLAKEVGYTEEKYLAVVEGMLKEAEDAIPEVLAMSK